MAKIDYSVMPVEEVRSNILGNVILFPPNWSSLHFWEIWLSLVIVRGCELRLKTLCPDFPIFRSLIQAPTRRVLSQWSIYFSWKDLSENIGLKWKIKAGFYKKPTWKFNPMRCHKASYNNSASYIAEQYRMRCHWSRCCFTCTYGEKSLFQI